MNRLVIGGIAGSAIAAVISALLTTGALGGEHTSTSTSPAVVKINTNYMDAVKQFTLQHGGNNGEVADLLITNNAGCSGGLDLIHVFNKDYSIMQHAFQPPIEVHAGDIQVGRYIEYDLLVDSNIEGYKYACTTTYNFVDKTATANNQLYTYTDIVPLNTDKQDIGIFYDTLKEYGAAVGSLKGHEDELNQYLERSNQSSVFNPQK